MIAAEVLRARFRDSFETPKAVTANQVTPYTIDLHTNDHTFLPGHRVMVQVQSTWFPVIDRNPQTFVPNIFKAAASRYQSATQRVYRSPTSPSHILLPVALCPSPDSSAHDEQDGVPRQPSGGPHTSTEKKSAAARTHKGHEESWCGCGLGGLREPVVRPLPVSCEAM
jgi:hypothetical protein